MFSFTNVSGPRRAQWGPCLDDSRNSSSLLFQHHWSTLVLAKQVNADIVLHSHRFKLPIIMKFCKTLVTQLFVYYLYKCTVFLEFCTLVYKVGQAWSMPYLNENDPGIFYCRVYLKQFVNTMG